MSAAEPGAPDAQGVLDEVNAATGGRWELDRRFARGRLGGAWRVRAGDSLAVLKWHDPASTASYNPDAPAVVAYLRAAGYPTPARLASGRTARGRPWALTEHVDGHPLAALDPASVEMFVACVDRQRLLRPPTAYDWNGHLRDVVFTRHPAHRRLAGSGLAVRRLLDAALILAAPHRATALPADEMVHGDLSVSNVLVRDDRLVAVVDVDAAGRGCAAYDLLAPAVNHVSWDGDRASADHLVDHGLDRYGAAVTAVVTAAQLIENTDWYRRSDPAGVEARAERHLDWLADLGHRLG